MKFTAEQIADILRREEDKISIEKNRQALIKSARAMLKRAGKLGFDLRIEKNHPCGDIRTFYLGA